MKQGDIVKTPHGIAKITFIETVYGSHYDRISVVFENGEISQYSSEDFISLYKNKSR